MAVVSIEKGKRYGSWTAIERAEDELCNYNGWMWKKMVRVRVKCDCGVEKEVRKECLESGRSNGCQSCARKRWHQRNKKTA